MKKGIKILTAFCVMGSLLVFSGCGCKKSSTKKYNLNLEIWGTLDANDAFYEIFDNYKKLNQNIANITYKKISTDTYKKELLDGLASGQGPDIFLMNNTWLPSFKDKIVAAPADQNDPQILNEQKFRDNFVDVAVNDFVDQGKIYAVPLSVDSLGLYYNKDLFNEAGIVSPPSTWNDFISDVRKLTKIDSDGNIVQSGAAIGTAYNINRSTDLLNLIMLQNGTQMISDRGRITFNDSSTANNKTVYPGEDALNFYTQFASPSSPNYTWNPNEHYSIDAFSEGETAMMINYSWHMATVANKSPKLNFAVAPIPQFINTPKVNFANYWGFAVAKNKTPSISGGPQNQASVTNDMRVAEAWRFLTYLTTKPDGAFSPASSATGIGKTVSTNFDPAKNYLEKTGEPAARRDIIELQKSDPRLGAFASGNLIDKSWKESDPDSIEAIFAEMIDQVNKGQATVADAMRTAQTRVQMLSNK